MIVLFLCIILFCIALTKVVPEPIVLFSGMLIFLISGGILGNRWYYSTIKYRIRKGYHLYKEYKPTSVSLLLIQVLCPIADKLIMTSNMDIQHFNLFRLLGIIILIVYWYKDKRAVKKITKEIENFQNNISEANVSHLI